LGFTILIELIKETAALEIGRISNEGRRNTWKKRKKKTKEKRYLRFVLILRFVTPAI
jgi:hypothetical protein